MSFTKAEIVIALKGYVMKTIYEYFFKFLNTITKTW